MSAVLFVIAVAAAGLGGYALLIRLGLDDLDAWAGGRVAGLVAVAVPAWWLGVLGVPFWRTVGAVLLALGAAAGGAVLWRRRARWRQVATAEAIFVGASLLVLLLRLDHPQIAGTEKPMDVGILATLLRTRGFPPPDMWLAGATLPYYYFGALLWVVPIAASTIPLEYAYNLVVAMIGGATAAVLWALGRRLAGGRHWAGLMAAFFGVFAGSPDAVRQLLGGQGLWSLDIWRSSRQNADLITEFPLFTLWLGDLHPHLLAMPVACLAFLVAWWTGRDGPRVSTAAALAVLFGVTWAANPWAMPPTLAAIALLGLTADGRWHWPSGEDRRRWLLVPAVLVGGWAVTAPFQLSFHPPFEGIARVFAWTSPATLLLYGGCLLIPALWAAARLLRSPEEGADARTLALTLAAAALTIVVATASRRPTLVVLAVTLAIMIVWLVRGGERWERPAVALAALGVFLFLVPEVLYVVDSYGSRLHRMNTVFKAYIQAWVLLALALPVLVMLCSRRRAVRTALAVVIVALALPHLVWMAHTVVVAPTRGLDGLVLMAPSDRALVERLRREPAGSRLIEAVGPAYSQYARLSANSGVPAYLGWENHEMVWRGPEITDETARRRALVEELYRCGEPARVRELVAESGADLVAIGALERTDFPESGLAAVEDAGTVERVGDGGELVRFPDVGGGPADRGGG